MAWLKYQLKGLRVSKGELAKRLDVSRPTLDKLEKNPSLLTVAQAAELKRAGVVVPAYVGSGIAYEPILCPECRGSGLLYRPASKEQL